MEHRFKSRWWACKDPEAVRGRVLLVNSVPTQFFVLAERIEKRELLVEAPQQSDYVREWKPGEASARIGIKKRLRKTLGSKLPPYIKRFLVYVRHRYGSSTRLHPDSFKRLKPR